jgi:2-polyprenyl-3-methyl-5-hydroxy-6-metoxy-1,4-benzoquinol methylase
MGGSDCIVPGRLLLLTPAPRTMRALDRFIQLLRIRKAAQWIRPDSRVLDIGCFDSSLFDYLGAELKEGIGLDPLLEKPIVGPTWRLMKGRLPGAQDLEGPFDAITLLAVLEHIPEPDLVPFTREIRRLLGASGRLIVTVPEPAVDRILAGLRRLHLIDGMSLEEHHGFESGRTRELFEGAGLQLVTHRRFQFGLNNLYVFEAPG